MPSSDVEMVDSGLSGSETKGLQHIQIAADAAAARPFCLNYPK
jgi:hypothetical protein